MDPQTYGWGSQERSGPYLARIRQECVNLVRPKTADEMRSNVTGCVLSKFTELDKVLYASRQYFLTLWPAFVAAIVAIAPDPSIMVYDNVWWSSLFAITSGGLPGIDSASPAHHVEAHSEREGRTMCETWLFDSSRPKAMSKEETMGSLTRGMGYIYFEWFSFFGSFALWISFCVYFGVTLKPAVDITFESNSVAGAAWYHVSAGPAIIGLVFELIRNRVDLYEPTGTPNEEIEASIGEGGKAQVASRAAVRRFHHVEVGSVFSLWLRILRHQWRRSQYRILVRNRRSKRNEWFFVLGRATAGMSPLAIFTVGSITMGNIILMPVPNDLYLFVLLLFTTSVPRQFWPAFWENGNRGADLVVWVKTIKMIGPESTI